MPVCQACGNGLLQSEASCSQCGNRNPSYIPGDGSTAPAPGPKAPKGSKEEIKHLAARAYERLIREFKWYAASGGDLSRYKKDLDTLERFYRLHWYEKFLDILPEVMLPLDNMYKKYKEEARVEAIKLHRYVKKLLEQFIDLDLDISEMDRPYRQAMTLFEQEDYDDSIEIFKKLLLLFKRLEKRKLEALDEPKWREKASVRQIMEAKALGLPVEFTDKNGMEFVFIPPGTMTMGSKLQADAQPLHLVKISEPFYLGRYPVIQGEWAKVMKDNPSRFKGRRLPVENVSWNTCDKFITELNKRGSVYKYRLPTEAEWEYASRADSSTEYYFGDDPGLLLWYGWSHDNSNKMSHEVGNKKSNAWELFDIYGNVFEWCEDWFAEYPNSARLDPVGPRKGEYKIFRGGSWYTDAHSCRCGVRNFYQPNGFFDYIGLRIAVSITK